jgi:NDP-sugar pyrophosphorylase family protein
VAHAAICAGGARIPALRDHVGGGAAFGTTLAYSEDRSPRGAAGCVRDAAELLCGGEPAAGDTFVVVEGALIPSVDLVELLRAHWLAEAAATIVVEVDRRRGIAPGPGPTVPGGVYVLDARAVRAVAPAGFHDIKQGLIERLYRAGERVAVHRVHGLSPRVLDFHSYLSVNRWLVERTAEQALDGYERVGDALVHHTARVHPGASLVGPALVGPGALLAEDVVVIGPTAIGARSRLLAGAVLTRSVVGEHCTVGRDAVVDTSALLGGSLVGHDRYVCGAVERPASADAPRPAAADVSPLWRLPALPNTPLHALPAAPPLAPLGAADVSSLLSA